MNEFDSCVINPSKTRHLLSLKSPLRRRMLIGSAVAGIFSSTPTLGRAASRITDETPTEQANTLFGFQGVPISMASDTVVVPSGYQWSVVAAWGDPIDNISKQISPDASDTSSDQEKQFGMHHDGCAFFPEHHSSSKGLWVVNHEYTDDGLLHTGGMVPWTAEKVRKSQAAHGVTVAMIERTANGAWRVVNSAFSRRITGYTPCSISGPASGHALMKTIADPTGMTVLGTLNNCANGRTPWGTYLTCEENINGYFVKSTPPTKEEMRIGLDAKGFGYRWHEHDERFNADKHPNEINRFGWVVEIDPHSPQTPPVKRTALGRFKHEGAMMVLAKNKKVVVYMGDDQRNEYIYKFVSRGKFIDSNPATNHQLLDEGTLYAARFNDNGTGQWIALEHGKNGLTAANGFPDQAYICIHARLAADFVNATPMDRPEWIAAHPRRGDLYVSLTNNSDRGVKTPLNAANPREKNLMGHILRWRETGNDATSVTFKWEIYALAGDAMSSTTELRGDLHGDQFGSPDGLWFDSRGVLWTQTDISTNTLGKGAYQNMPNNCMYASNPETHEFRRFLIGPKGCEITGIDITPDHRTMFINIQHPGESPSERADPANPTAISNWPDASKFKRPRSATIAIWRNDGAMIGS